MIVFKVFEVNMAVTEENVGCAGQVCIGLIMFGMFSVVTSIMFIGIGGGTGTEYVLNFWITQLHA